MLYNVDCFSVRRLSQTTSPHATVGLDYHHIDFLNRKSDIQIATLNMDTKSIIDQYRPSLLHFEEIYKDIHRNPELSRQEARTASIIASHLDSLRDFTVHRNIGGHGIVGVLRNNNGPIVLLRADMDALPHLEATGLPYASMKTDKNVDGETTPVSF